jgi:hypothetical protein
MLQVHKLEKLEGCKSETVSVVYHLTLIVEAVRSINQTHMATDQT